MDQHFSYQEKEVQSRFETPKLTKVDYTMDHWLWMVQLLEKFQNAIFFHDIKNSFHGVTQMGLKQHQIFFQIFSPNMVPRGVQNFCILEDATDSLI